MYATYDFYKSLYDNDLTEADFNRLAWDTDRMLDRATTGLGGVRKLRVAYPTDEYGDEAVKRCACALVDIMRQLKAAEDNAASASGFIETANGLQGKVISSVSAGNESVSFATSANANATRISAAVSDTAAREQLFMDTIYGYIDGVRDANGIPLRFMGNYPLRYITDLDRG